MTRSGRPKDRFPVDEPVYPPPIGEQQMPRGRPRARTFGDDAHAPPPYPSPEPRSRGPAPVADDFSYRPRHSDRRGKDGRRQPPPPEDWRPEPRPEPRRDQYYPPESELDPRQSGRGPVPAYQSPPPPPPPQSGNSKGSGGHRRRHVYSPPEPEEEWDHRPPGRAAAYRSPPPPPPSGHRRRDDYTSPDTDRREPSPPRRAKSAAVRRGPRMEASPPPPRRYDSPDPAPRRRRSPRPHREPPQDRDMRYNRPPYDDHDSPREPGPDPRRSKGVKGAKGVNMPPYAEGYYRPDPRRRSSFDRAAAAGDRGRPSQRRHQSPSPPPPRRARPRSMPAKNKAGRLPASMQNVAWQTVARTAFTAGAQAAYKARNDPAPWMGEKGARVATAALGAAIMDGFIGSKGQPDKGNGGGKKTKGFQKAAGFAADKFAERSNAKKR